MDKNEAEKKLQQLSSFRTLMLTSIISAMALVVGLFWNDAIKATIDQIVPKGDSLFYKYLAAIVVSIIVVVFVYILMHAQKLAQKRLEELAKKTQKKGILKLR